MEPPQPERFKLPTPSLRHFTSDDYTRVYEPSEDTFLLLDAIEQDSGLLLATRPRIVLEVGSGSGTPITALVQLLSPPRTACPPLAFATDINEHAARGTLATARANGAAVEAVRTNLVDALAQRLAGVVDVLLFNPPYVPTESSELGKVSVLLTG